MQKQSVFTSRWLPFALIAPQLVIVLVFFYWPAGQAVRQSFLLQDAFGLSTTFIWFENYRDLLSEPEYFATIVRTFVFAFAKVLMSVIAIWVKLPNNWTCRRTISLSRRTCCPSRAAFFPRFTSI